jgi:hypothetical protein
MPKAVAGEMLRLCAHPRMNYIMRTTNPTDIQDGIRAFDAEVRGTFAELIDRTEPMPPLAEKLISLPLGFEHGGCGLRNLLDISRCAYLGSLPSSPRKDCSIISLRH